MLTSVMCSKEGDQGHQSWRDANARSRRCGRKRVPFALRLSLPILQPD